METFNLTLKELLLYLALIGAAIGLVLGLIALLLAVKRGKKNLGYGALVTCIITGIISPLVAIIAFGVFIWMIFSSARGVQEVEVVNEEPIGVDVSEPKDS
jgi:hypothetical protein